MFRLALRNLFSRKLRFALTALAIVLGTAMISGTYVLTDQITGAFDEIFEKANTGVDVVVTKKLAFQSQSGTQSAFPETEVKKVLEVPGVAAAEGLLDGTGSLVVDGKSAASVGGAPSLLVSVNPDTQFDAVVRDQGRDPKTSGEVSVDVATAKKHNLTIGQKVAIATTTGVIPVTVVGTFKFGDSDSLGGTTIVAALPPDVQKWLDQPGQNTSIAIAADPGVDPARLAQRVQTALGDPQLRVETGSQSSKRQSQEINDNLGFLRTMLLVFAAISILVGGFVIFNIFSITIAQRIREMAMLRTVGATRRQLRTSVLLEALTVGVIASIIGIGGGVLLAMGIKAAFAAADFGLPTAGIQLKPRTIIVPLIVGVVATVLSALIPAIRATKISPVAALREGAVLPNSRFSRYVPALGVIAVVLGGVVTFIGMGLDASVTRKLSVIAFGALLIIIGVALALRIFIAPLARIVGAPFSAIFGKTAQIGRQNTIRQPERTASTATALMIGVGLVIFIATFVAAFKSSFFTAIDKNIDATQVTMSENFQPMPERVVAASRAVPGVENAVGIGTVEAQVDGKNTFPNAIDPAGARGILRFDWRSGNASALDALGTDGAAVEEGFARDNGLGMGDTFKVTSIEDITKTFTVRGIYRDPQLFTGFVISDRALAELTAQPQVSLVFTKFAPGIPIAESTSRLQETLKAEVPTAKVRSRQEYKDFVNQQTTQFLSILYVLLALSVFISLVGVIITLFLAIYERTREIGMLRAVGTTRGQIRSMIRFESIITCVIGGIVGVLVGLLLGWLIVLGLRDEGLSFTAPIGTIIVVVILAFVAGLIAAIFPARRAAKLRPLEALQYE